MTDVLFALWEGGGNVPPQLDLAGALVRRGHRVRVLADRILREEVEAAGAEHVAWTRAPQPVSRDPADAILRDWEARTPLGAFAAARDSIITGPSAAYAADTAAELERREPDVLAHDFMLPGAAVAAEAAGVPRAALVHCAVGLPEWGVPPMGPGLVPASGPLARARDAAVGRLNRRLFDKGLPALNAARREHGLEPVGSAVDAVLSGDRMLLLLSRTLEFPQCSPPDRVVFCGPRVADPAWAGEWEPPPGDEPLVLVGLSTTYMKQAKALQRIADALGRLPVRGLVTTGRAVAPGSIVAPSNVTVVEAAPHAHVLRHAAAVVTHGGYGTLVKALLAGVPVVAMPMGRDQHDNAARLRAAGAGVRLRAGASPARIARAVRAVLDDPAYATAARRLADGIAEELRRDRAVEEIEALGAAHASAPAVA